MNHFTFEITDDGSPTLRIGNVEPLSEAMHSLRGAFSETVYIYGTAISRAFGLKRCRSPKEAPRILSMGLGMGYVEILSAALALQTAWKTKDDNLVQGFGGESFEILPELRERFRAWVFDEELPADFKQAYDYILDRSAQETGQEGSAIKSLLRSAIESGRWIVREELTADTKFTERFGCVCFDAFSSKSTPDLWTEEFLMKFLEKTAAPDCVLSTYACTGSLKRSLKASGFDLQIREGFHSKRDSTFAVRVFDSVSN